MFGVEITPPCDGLNAIIGIMSNPSLTKTTPPNFSQIPLPQIAQERFARLQTRTARIGVIGLGYVGLPLSLLLSEAGFKVTGFDNDAKKVDDLEAGRSYILRILPAEIAVARQQGFSSTTDFASLSHQDAIILCVPTPLTGHREPDLSFVENTARAVAPWIREGQLVVLESTTYPGTTDDLLIPVLEAGSTEGLKVQGKGAPEEHGVFYVAFSPEREDPATSLWRGATFPRWWAGTKQWPPSLRRPSTKGYLPERCASRPPAWQR